MGVLLLTTAVACHRGWRRSHSRPRHAVPVAAPSAPPPAAGGTLWARTPPLYSSPIAAVRTKDAVVVAGFVADEGVVRVTSLRDGGVAWAVDAVRGATWAPDAELKLDAGAGNVAVLWRSGRADRHAASLVVIGADGAVRGAPHDVGVAECASDAGLVWIEPGSSGPFRVRGMGWSDAAARDLLSVPPERTPTLSCGDRAVFVLGDGDDDLTASTVALDAAGPVTPRVVLRASDFQDDELEHEAFAVDPQLEVLRVGNSGGLSIRDLAPDGPLGPWRRLHHRLSADDDIVTVDGDATSTIAVYTREAEDACPSSGAPALRVRALRVDRPTSSEAVVDLVAPSCDETPAPIWIDERRGAPPIVGWAERRSREEPGTSPIAGFTYRVLDDGDAGAPRHVAIEAQALVNAGCALGVCAVAALESPSGDAMVAMPIAVVQYP